MGSTLSLQRLVVGEAEMRIATQPGVELITHALAGSLGITVHDPVAGVGGLLHVLLPQSQLDPERAAQNPALFVDTAVPRLFKDCYRFGAKKERMVLKVAGAAKLGETETGSDLFRVGKRNLVALRGLLWKHALLIAAQDVGGMASRSLSLQLGTGAVTVASGGARVSL